MAAKHKLFGEVDNRTDGVYVIVQGDLKIIERFSSDILRNAPPASLIKSIEINKVNVNGYNNFVITCSKSVDNQITEISPDIAVCNDCLDDMEKDPERIMYPFVNCTQLRPTVYNY